MGCAAPNRGRARRAAAVAVVAALLAPPEAHAALIGSCGVVILSSGRLMPDAAIATLDSAQAGGAAVQVQVKVSLTLCDLLRLIDCFRVSAPPPTSFLASPAGGDTGVNFSTSYRINGGAAIPGSTPKEIGNGTHTVAVDLAAQRSSGVFPAGAYQAQLTVRCE